MSERIRVVVWGPGGLGGLSIRELSMLPEFELVGVYAYSPDKHGVDAGELAGIGPIGIKASNNAAEVLAIPCDCVLYCARDLATFHNDDEIVRLLEAGKNLVTALPYHHMHVTRPPEFVARVEAACQKAGSVFHATGVNPDLISDRLLPTLTGLCNDIKHVKMQENWDIQFMEVGTLKVCGYGEAVEVAAQSPVVAAISANFVRQGLMAWAESLGVTYERVEVEHDYPVADRDLQYGDFKVAKGTVSCISNRMHGYVKGQERPFMTVEVNWAFDHTQLPPGVPQAQGWVLSIEGRPSLRTTIEVKTSLDSDERFLVPGDPRTEAGYDAVVATLIKGIISVRKAPPGILKPLGSPVRWTPDLRTQ